MPKYAFLCSPDITAKASASPGILCIDTLITGINDRSPGSLHVIKQDVTQRGPYFSQSILPRSVTIGHKNYSSIYCAALGRHVVVIITGRSKLGFK